MRQKNLQTKKNFFFMKDLYNVAEDVQKDKIDPLHEQVTARAAAMKRFRASLEFDAIVCGIEHYRDGFNPLDFIDDLQNVLDEAKRKLAEKGIHRKI